jgi:hypothetical protein
MAAALELAEAVLEHGVAGAPLSATVRSIALGTISWLHTAPLDQSRKGTCTEAGIGPTKEAELEAAGIFEAYAANSRIRVTSRSIARYRLANAILSRPVDGPPLKIRQPKARFQKRRREPTPAELAGLRKGNEGRRLKHQKDQHRREAKAAAGA